MIWDNLGPHAKLFPIYAVSFCINILYWEYSDFFIQAFGFSELEKGLLISNMNPVKMSKEGNLFQCWTI